MNVQTTPNPELFIEGLKSFPHKRLASYDHAMWVVDKAYPVFGQASNGECAVAAIEDAVTEAYEAAPGNWPSDKFSLVAAAYGGKKDFKALESISQRLLECDPTNVDALRAMGIAKRQQGEFRDAAVYLRKAYDLGDNQSLLGLAGCYLVLKDYSDLKNLAPALLEVRKQDAHYLNLLFLYSITSTPADRQVFRKALDGLTDEQLLERQSTAELVIRGLLLFDQNERADRLLKMKIEKFGAEKQDGSSANGSIPEY